MEYEIVHSCIRVMNLERSLKFYEEALNFKEVRRKDFPKDGFTLVYLSDGSSSHQLELTFNYNQEEPYIIGNGYSHLAVVVEDLESSYENHQQMGYQVTKLSGLPGSEPKFYFISDPDGYAIEVIRR
ncbi:MAG: VOC family protein [Eubacteriales bacterium]